MFSQTDASEYDPEKLNRNTSEGSANIQVSLSRFYKCRPHQVRGIALIFNHKRFEDSKNSEFPGTEVDRDDLKNTLTSLKYDVHVYDDKKKFEIMTYLKDVAKKDHSSYDSIFIAFLTRRDEYDQLCTYDRSFAVEEVVDLFSKCLSLVGKPKLFFIQACRGQKADQGVAADMEFDSCPGPVAARLPTMADILLIYVTFHGFVSLRDEKHGSYYTRIFCEELRKEVGSSEKQEILAILTNVNHRMASEVNVEFEGKQNIKQIGAFLSSLTKKFHFDDK